MLWILEQLIAFFPVQAGTRKPALQRLSPRSRFVVGSASVAGLVGWLAGWLWLGGWVGGWLGGVGVALAAPADFVNKN